jgi:molybdate transport system substrate-binding protein
MGPLWRRIGMDVTMPIMKIILPRLAALRVWSTLQVLPALLGALLLAALPALPARAAPLLVAAASDLTYCIDELAAAFGKEVAGAEVKVSLGASGNFLAQIRNGAPFDVFLSADMKYPAQLVHEGAADGASLAPYAIGRIALWSLDPRFAPGEGLRAVDDPRVTRIAIANPDSAPYGRAARAALQHYGLWERVTPKLVVGENIAQTAQFVRTGNAQLGIVSLAAIASARPQERGSYYLIPETAAPPIEQGAVVTRHGMANPLAARFVRFLQSAPARAILSRSGFGLPPALPHEKRERQPSAHD